MKIDRIHKAQPRIELHKHDGILSGSYILPGFGMIIVFVGWGCTLIETCTGNLVFRRSWQRMYHRHTLPRLCRTFAKDIMAGDFKP